MSAQNIAAGDSERPLAAIDVDGVISLFGFRCAEEASERGDWHLVDGTPHCISRTAGSRLRRLSETFDLIWATGWEERANDHLPHLLGLPTELPVLSFDRSAVFGQAHWKLAAIEDYCSGRPLAWVDDCFTDECRSWAAARPEPTLLVPTEADLGLEEGHVEAMIAWVHDGYTA